MLLKLLLLSLVCVAVVAPPLCSAQEDLFVNPSSAETAADDPSSSLEEQDARTFFTSNGNYYLALNTTYLLFYVALFGIGLLAALALASLFGGTEESGYGYGGGGGGYNRHGHQGYHHHNHYRQRRAFDDGEARGTDGWMDGGGGQKQGCHIQ